jgi:hypothetical protein
LLRRGLADLIKYEVDLEVIGEAANGGKAFSPGLEKSLRDAPSIPKLTDKHKHPAIIPRMHRILMSPFFQMMFFCSVFFTHI